MNNLSKNVLRPLATRIGTYMAGCFGTWLAITDPTTLASIETAIVTVILVGSDLFTNWLERR